MTANREETEKRFLVPVVTPFNDDETVNYDALQRLVEDLLQQGADGVYACGSSAECFSMTEAERMKVLEAVLEAADGAFVVAHIGAIATGNSLRLARHAEKAGAGAISSVPPFYFKYSFDEIMQYYVDIADHSGLPMMAYNFPASTNTNFNVAQLVEILSYEKIKYMKFTDMDCFMLEQIKSRTGKFIYSGKDEIFLSALAAGADGAIGTSFNVMLGKYLKIYRLFLEGNMQMARAVQHSANEIVSVLCSTGLLESIKFLIGRKGIGCGHARKPFSRLTEESKRRLIEVVEREGFE